MDIRMSTRPTDEPPICGTWNRLYVAIMVWFGALILFFIFLEKHFQ